MKLVQVLLLALSACAAAMPLASPRGNVPEECLLYLGAYTSKAVMPRDADDEIMYPDEKFYAEEYKRCKIYHTSQCRTASAKLS